MRRTQRYASLLKLPLSGTSSLQRLAAGLCAHDLLLLTYTRCLVTAETEPAGECADLQRASTRDQVGLLIAPIRLRLKQNEASGWRPLQGHSWSDNDVIQAHQPIGDAHAKCWTTNNCCWRNGQRSTP